MIYTASSQCLGLLDISAIRSRFSLLFFCKHPTVNLINLSLQEHNLKAFVPALSGFGLQATISQLMFEVRFIRFPIPLKVLNDAMLLS